jgi:hypothetical protein
MVCMALLQVVNDVYPVRRVKSPQVQREEKQNEE